MFQLTKKFRFEAAHRLGNGYPGKCRYVHGHSWNGELCLVGSDLDQYNMLIDFGYMKQLIRETVDIYDHALLLGTQDAVDKKLYNLLIEDGQQVFIFEKNPTSELLAKLIYIDCERKLADLRAEGSCPPGISVKHVRIEETCTTSCTYYE